MILWMRAAENDRWRRKSRSQNFRVLDINQSNFEKDFNTTPVSVFRGRYGIRLSKWERGVQEHEGQQTEKYFYSTFSIPPSSI